MTGRAMPRTVDPEVRRREVTEIAVKLVVEGGRSALTVRRVAAAAGCSSTVVSHYFEDMADLFRETYAYAAARASRRTKAALAKDPSDIIGVVEALLPLDVERTDDWRVWFAFWSEALTSPRFAEEQRERARSNLVRIEGCLKLLAEQRRLTPTTNVTDAAHRLAALVPGIASEAIFDPTRWSPKRQREVLRTELQLLGFVPKPKSKVRASSKA